MAKVLIEGIYCDQLWEPNGELRFDSGWRKNMIVMQGRRLLAGFMKNEATAHGIQSMKIGHGDPLWDTNPPPQPDPNTMSKLVDAAPFVITGGNLTLQYLLPDDTPTLNVTNRVQITAVLGPGQPVPAGNPVWPTYWWRFHD